MEWNFRPNYEVIESIYGTATVEEMSKETGVYSATPEFVREHCGRIANLILDSVPEEYFQEALDHGLHPNIDVRIHRLYPGDFPAYPGWHCDGQFRETYFTQPSAEHIMVGRHVICTVSTHDDGVSNTEFLSEPFDMESRIDEQGGTLWGELDDRIKATQPHKTWSMPDGEIVLFDSYTPHRCRPALVRRWRLFFRLAQWYRPNLGDGQISKQEHIYKILEGTGW